MNHNAAAQIFAEKRHVEKPPAAAATARPTARGPTPEAVQVNAKKSGETICSPDFWDLLMGWAKSASSVLFCRHASASVWTPLNPHRCADHRRSRGRVHAAGANAAALRNAVFYNGGCRCNDSDLQCESNQLSAGAGGRAHAEKNECDNAHVRLGHAAAGFVSRRLSRRCHWRAGDHCRRRCTLHNLCDLVAPAARTPARFGITERHAGRLDAGIGLFLTIAAGTRC